MDICYNINSEIDFESLVEKSAGLFLCPEGGVTLAKKTETTLCLPRLSQPY